MLVAIGVVTAVAVLTLPETLPPDRRHPETALQLLAGYGEILRNRGLLGYAAAVGFFYVGVFANIAGGAFAYISYHGLSPEAYGLVFSSGVLGLMAANVINARLVTSVGSDTMLLAGATGAALFGVALAVVTATDFGGVAGLIIAQFMFTAMNGLILANGVAGALSSVQHRAGAASAVVGVIQYGSGMFGSAAVGFLANGTPVPMGLVMALASLGCLASTLWVRKSMKDS